MSTLGKAHVVITASLKPLKMGLAKAKKMVSTAMRKITKIIKRSAIAIAAALTGAIIAAAKFQKQLAFVSTMLDRETMPLMKGYEKLLKDMAVQFGESTATLSTGLYDILSASIAASKAPEVLRVSAIAAVAGMTDTRTAADALTTIINAFAMDASRAEEVSDKLFATVKRGKLTFPELANSIGMVASTAAIAGMGLEELLATISTLTRAGINANRAVTAINGVLRAFIKPQDDAVKVAAEFGLELSSNTLKTIGFTGAVKKLNNATAEQLAQIVPRIRGFKALAAALKNQAGLNFDLRLIAVDSAGRAEEAYEKMANTLSFQFGRLKEAIKNTFRVIGKPIAEALKPLIEFKTEGLDKINLWLEKNQDKIKEWADTVVAQVKRVAEYFGGFLPQVQPNEVSPKRTSNRLAAALARRAKRRARYNIRGDEEPQSRLAAALARRAERRGTSIAGEGTEIPRKPLSTLKSDIKKVFDKSIATLITKLNTIPTIANLIKKLGELKTTLEIFKETLKTTLDPLNKHFKEFITALKEGDLSAALKAIKEISADIGKIGKDMALGLWAGLEPKMKIAGRLIGDGFVAAIKATNIGKGIGLIRETPQNIKDIVRIKLRQLNEESKNNPPRRGLLTASSTGTVVVDLSDNTISKLTQSTVE